MELKTAFSSCLILFPFFPATCFSVFINTRERVILVVIREVCLVEIWIGHLRNRLEPSCGWTEQQDGQQAMQIYSFPSLPEISVFDTALGCHCNIYTGLFSYNMEIVPAPMTARMHPGLYKFI